MGYWTRCVQRKAISTTRLAMSQSVMIFSSEIQLPLFICLAIMAIFLFDSVMVVDDVSIAFMYTVPIFLSIRGRYGLTYLYVAATTIFSVMGATLLPPDHGLSFYINRVIAILAQWIVAALVLSRKRSELILDGNLQMEREKAERQRRFLDILSHEIGTSLTTIDGQTFRLLRRRSVHSTDEIVQRGTKIRASVRHIQALIQHVQLADEVEEKTLRPVRAMISIEQLIEDVIQQAKEAYPHISFHINTDALPATLHADPFMMRQIMENLVSNAAKYSPAGTVVTIEGEEADGEMRLRVTDKGRGIPKDELDRVFHVYYRATNSRGIHGTGVGLYVSERFAAAHGGSIAIDSQLDIGTVVTVHIPVLKQEQAN
jgi:signal transduction histidine kinase